MLTLIENGDIHAPEPRGRGSVLLIDGKIGKIGRIDRAAIERTGLEVNVIDAEGCVVAPGLIDPHEHLLGGSGEDGFSTQTPPVTMSEIVTAGITTVVGTLGVDTTMHTMTGLLARVKALKEEGLSGFMWTGGYNVPPVTVTTSIRTDMLFIDEVVGAGEIAIADHRGLCPQPPELAKLVLDTNVGGLLSGKAGVTHFHVGEDVQRLLRLRELLDGPFAVSPEMLYPTHVNRSEALIEEAVELVKRGSYVDMDTVSGELTKWVRCYLDHGGDPAKLTISSDSGTTPPRKLYEEFCNAVVRGKIPLDTMLPMLTSNTATVLKLKTKGRIEVGNDGDLAILTKDGLDIRHVISGGRHMVRDGSLTVGENFLKTMSRTIELVGEK